MANAWFRMYSEFANDPKVQMLSEADQRRYIMVLCMRCSNDDVTLHDEEVAFQLRISNDEWTATKRTLVAKGLVTDDNKPTAWDKRQFLSDSSAERVKRHRAKRAAQGLPQQNSIPPKVRLAVFDRDNCACIYCGSEEDLTIDHKIPQSRGGSDEVENLATACRPCNASKRDLTDEEFVARKNSNVTVTPYIQITDTDKEDKSSLAAQQPKTKSETPKAKRLPSDWTLPKSWGEWTLENMGWAEPAVRVEAEKFKDYWTAKGGREACKTDWQATWRNWCRNAKTPTAAPVLSLLAGGI